MQKSSAAHDCRRVSTVMVGAEEGDRLLTCTAVDILEAHDIVLAQIGARLNFDNFERHFARIL